MNILKLTFLSFLLTMSALLFADPQKIEIWQGVEMPGASSSEPEKGGGKYENHSLGFQRVNRAALDFYPADAEKPAGAVIICPGGGYKHLAYGKEGTQIAEFLSSNGINCFVLKYRIPDNRDGAFMDAQRALRVIRKNAKQWNIDPNKVGIMGFSAGGHLSARVSTNSDAESYKPLDAADKFSARPDFTVLIYPAYIGDNNTYELKPEIRIDEKTPPAFISQTQDDVHYVGSSIAYYLALKKCKVSADLHLYSQGGHGYGLREKEKPVSQWGEALVDWLKFNKFAE